MQKELSLKKLALGDIHIAELSWAAHSSVFIAEELADYLQTRGELDKKGKLSLFPESLDATLSDLAKNSVVALRLHRAFTETKPLYHQLLPFNYQWVPARIRSVIATFFGRYKFSKILQEDFFPQWPLDLSADFVADLACPPAAKSQKTKVILSHDHDSLESLQNVHRYFLPIEENYGARSANFIVPCAYDIKHNLVEDLIKRGHELGIHGFDHSHITPFANPKLRLERLSAASSLIKKYDCKGYRAPSLFRTKALLEDLANFYAYDSSIPSSGGIFPIEKNGCATARPFKLNHIWEIPLTLPADGNLLFNRHSPDKILSIWLNIAHRIKKSGGIVHLLTHCERRFSGNPTMLNIYDQFLNAITCDENFEMVLPREILSGLKEVSTS